MAAPSYRTWVTSEIVNASEMNVNIRDAGNFFLSRPVFEGRQTIAQNLTNAVQTPITFDTEDVDTDNGHSTATNTSRYTAQTAGRYQVSGGIGYAANTTGQRAACWTINGANNLGSENQVNTTAAFTMMVPARTKTLFLAVTDYVELNGVHTAGGTLATSVTGLDQPNMSVRWVGTT